MTLALVLGGGGIAGIAWHTGILLGLVQSDSDPTVAEVLVGTSAGATVAAQVGSGSDLAELFRRQVDAGTRGAEIASPVSMTDLIGKLAPIFSGGYDAAECRRRLGALALAANTVEEAERHRVIAARLDGLDWPDRRVDVVVVDAATGERRVFDRSSGVTMVDAVAASSAVPGVWPPVAIGGHRYVDGGVWSVTNTDLASGCDRVLVLAPIVDPALGVEVAGLGPDVRVEVIRPDAASLTAFGTDVLDLAVREPSARAGLVQGHAEADRVRDLLAG
jgi:NTE family protein